MKYLHYTETPIVKLFDDSNQMKAPFHKPTGLWISIGDKWKRWCEKEEFRLNCLKIVYNIILHKKAPIYYINNENEFLEFEKKYCDDNAVILRNIYWEKVRRDGYMGIIIPKYFYKLRNRLWYSTWDIPSGCIWDINAINRIEQI